MVRGVAYVIAVNEVVSGLVQLMIESLNRVQRHSRLASARGGQSVEDLHEDWRLPRIRPKFIQDAPLVDAVPVGRMEKDFYRIDPLTYADPEVVD
jgi:hypothetical protein